jgi:hypothetical protein
MLATIVGWSALGQVAAYALAAGVAIAALFTGGLRLIESDEGTGVARAARPALGGLCLLACAALVGAGLYVVFTTK